MSEYFCSYLHKWLIVSIKHTILKEFFEVINLLDKRIQNRLTKSNSNTKTNLYVPSNISFDQVQSFALEL